MDGYFTNKIILKNLFINWKKNSIKISCLQFIESISYAYPKFYTSSFKNSVEATRHVEVHLQFCI